jgi:cytochrome bd ubiquinol oxidase subunit II
MAPSFLQTTAFIMALLFFCIYSLLDGFDLGIGGIVPFAKKREDAERLVSLIAPFWDGNEVWLVMGAGFIFAAFPPVYAVLLSAFYLPFMAAIAAFILRAVAIEFSYHDEAHAQLWRIVMGAASLSAAFAGLTVLGFLISGLPFENNGQLSRRIGDYLLPFPFLFGLAGLSMIIWHGMTYAIGKQPAIGLQKISGRYWYAAVCAAAAIICSGFFFLPGQFRNKPFIWIGGGFFVMGLLSGKFFLDKGGWAYRFSCVSIIGLWIAVGALLFPYVLPAKEHPEWSISIAQAAAPHSSLKLIVIVCAVMIPVIASYTYFVYRTFRHTDKNVTSSTGG